MYKVNKEQKNNILMIPLKILESYIIIFFCSLLTLYINDQHIMCYQNLSLPLRRAATTKNSTDSYQWRALTHQWQTVVCLLPTSAISPAFANDRRNFRYQ